MLKAAKAYLSTQINTTSQGEVLLMLYEGAIKFLSQAKQRMREKNYAEKGILISRALDVIAELDGSLNAEKGGELAQNLHKLYFYCNTRLLRANLEMNEEYVDEVIKILEAMRTAFKQISSTDGPAAAGPVPVRPATGEADEPEESPARTVTAYAASVAAAAPAARVAAPDDAKDEAEDKAEAEAHKDGDGPEAEGREFRPANLRMVAKLKAYHRAGS